MLTYHKYDAATGRKALQKAGGEWEHTRQHQAHTKPDPDDGWSTYISKDHLKMTAYARALLAGSKSASGITGAWFGSTDAVRKRARELYEPDRRLIIETKARLCLSLKLGLKFGGKLDDL